MAESAPPSDAHYQTLFDYAPDGILIADPETVYLDANPAACRMLGYGRDELIGLAAPDIVAPSETPHIEPAIETITNSGDYYREWRFVRKDGSTFDAAVMATVLPDGNLLAILRDLTPQRKSDADIRQLNRMLHLMSDVTHAIVRERDIDRMLQSACQIAVQSGNFRMACIVGLNPSDQSLHLVAHAGADDETLAIVGETMGSTLEHCGCSFTKRAIEYCETEVCNQIAEDPESELWREAAVARGYLSMTALPIHYDGSVWGAINLYAGEANFFDAEELKLLEELAMDISFALEMQRVERERRSLEQQFRQSQKIEVFGQLAGGIAHDFNNLLTIINGFSEILQDPSITENQRREAAEAIHQAGQESAALTRQLLTFSRRQVLKPRIVDINRVVRETLTLLRRLIGEQITLDANLDDATANVRLDSGQFVQVLLNLAVNARDAMPDGGLLTLSTSVVASDGGPGEILVNVSDTGTGMPARIADRAFEPFFTTKPVGEGTGLGLAVVHGIVEQSGGRIAVESQQGRGTTFRIALPLSDEVSPVTDESRERQAPQGETLLLAEDDPGVRRLVRRYLEREGYTVIEASDGEQAVEVFESHDGAIDLLLTDVVMPGMDGPSLATALQSQMPDLRVLYITGYTTDALVLRGEITERAHVLQKPFSQDALVNAVKEALEEQDVRHSASRG